jgi:hypothetical protein
VRLWFLGDIKVPHPDFCWLSLVLSLVEVFFQLLKTLSKRLIQKSQVMLSEKFFAFGQWKEIVYLSPFPFLLEGSVPWGILEVRRIGNVLCPGTLIMKETSSIVGVFAV